MLCYVSLPDFVLKEFKIRDKARGQDLLEEVRCFVLLWAQSPAICFQSIFSDVTFFSFALTRHDSLTSLP